MTDSGVGRQLDRSAPDLVDLSDLGASLVDMAGPDGDDVDAAVEEMLGVLGPEVDRDWSVRAGRLEWSCTRTAAHVAHDLLAYAGQLAAQPADAYLPCDLTVRDGATPEDVLRVVTACGGLLGTALRAAASDTRAWHWGSTDPTGFAALGMNETLVHTWDVCQGLGLPWRPPTSMCEAVLRRLVPDAPEGDPADVLLWATGRAALGDRPRLREWTGTASVDRFAAATRAAGGG